jgi:hypothetical protein
MHTNETPEMRLQTHSLGISTPKTEKAEISFTRFQQQITSEN